MHYFCDDFSELEDKPVLGQGVFLSLRPVLALHHLGLQDPHLPYVHVLVVPGDNPHNPSPEATDIIIHIKKMRE